ncbi:glycosyltransferase family 2 protein [Mesobacterium sp. TK19101]|uniref:Glycosyltransferase family 2 protein n=1 Tax=Mesobacterium hydrothermale TaxID=3111907 RepID=A0ABU6HFS1_9RHOB|nr:glycosyltransferase family 2 protein [Mesobacterium sp. TK19101]MEC3861298.1 glycosyltransferase family 2 protein [Mesobacterium sp. TK19101]
MRLLTIILNYRTADMTVRSVQAALGAMHGLDGEITVVDNDSGDGSFETIQARLAAADWAQERMIRVIQSGRNGGFGAGNNVGIRAGLSDGTKPDYVYILNSDAFPQPDAIRKLIAHLDSHPEAGFAGSYIYGDDDEPHMTQFRFPCALGELEGAARTGPISRLLKNHAMPIPIPQETCRVDWLAGASMLMRQSVLDDIGLFDETFFLYFEETDLSLRALRAGHETHFVRDSEVMHIGSVSTGMRQWTRIPVYWLDSRWHYYTKNHGRAYAVWATTLRLLGEGIWQVRRILQRKAAAGPDHFSRDLIAHHLKALFRPLPGRPRIPRATQPMKVE